MNLRMKNPILLDIPISIITPRLLLRFPKAGDGKAIHEAVFETFDQLHTWMPWADTMPTEEDSELVARQFLIKTLSREEVHFVIIHGAILAGLCGIHHINWEVSSAAIGYWCRKGLQNQGLMQEAINALTQYAFLHMGIKRLTIDCDATNRKSANVAEKLGYTLEVEAKGLMHTPNRPDLSLCRRYVRFNCDNLPQLETKWEQE